RIALPRIIPGGTQPSLSAVQAALLGHLAGDGCTLPRHSMQYTTREIDTLSALATSDVYWDQIRSISPDGDEEVYDLTVPGPANFVAGDIIVHNSIEQDADTVMILHRPELYEPGQHEGTVEVIIAKQRNGPTGELTLTYLKQYMRFEDHAVGTPFDI
ncbi:MAG TPA: DnaB-like helicase C-terminal domain-containing protein, partial [Gemmataceae bacterium]|nr:DnaB-like helicase C-terminal domain-containing protein [Gemmataceae bacterium]